MNRVLVFGTFDELHPGHLVMLQEARNYGDHLIAAVSRDRYVHDTKERTPKLNEEERLQLMADYPLVDEVILCDRKLGSFNTVSETKPDVIALGYDQDELYNSLKKWLKKTNNRDIELVRLKPYQPDKYKTSYVRH